MASIANLGVGSGLELSSLLSQLGTAERQPLVALEARAKSYTTKLSAYGTLQSSVSALQTASARLSSLSLFQGVKAASSFNTVLTASAETTAVAGSYAINVSQLAQAQSLATTGQASASAAVGSGTMTFDFGAVATDDVVGSPTFGQQYFKSDVSRSATVTIGTNNTLEGIRDAVNAANAGVSASIVNDGSGTPHRLVLVSSQTGAASSMKISVVGDAALGTLMNHDPLGTPTMTETLQAKNAQLTVNGLAISSATNTVSESMQGVTLTLASKGDSTLTVARDTSSVSSAINAFVAAYNGLLSTGAKLTSYDADTQKGSALTGDSTLRNLQVRIRGALTSPQSGATGDFTMLSNIGVSFQKDGTLAVDATKLEAALGANMDGVAKLFAGSATDTAGYGKQLSALALSFTATGGALTAAADGLTTSIKRLDKQYDAMETRIEATVARYRAQFTQLDIAMSSMNSTTSYLTAQFDAMNANAGK
ncbi:MAG: flagellar filament capping protein FliD [Polaromonas sp.]|uniref:flagellar filament capping protein FliD n=1 Tax=Polaromonas sp. TaxID=1869339 RepID=UPI0024879522|nr:flagellar filament capping protein FliD [Polaromonas sp.]MDI1268723.1 flagellar filament capping protein FliD [Polaromonas sp.]